MITIHHHFLIDLGNYSVLLFFSLVSIIIVKFRIVINKVHKILLVITIFFQTTFLIIRISVVY